jgi:uncharacterized membrane protein YdjX (TVP38/TMEM64 family)
MAVRSRTRWILLAALAPALAVFVAFALARLAPVDVLVGTVHRFTGGGGFFAMIAFACATGVLVVFFFPGSVLMTAAGAAFGLAWGFVTAQVGASLGAALAFLVSRHLARRGVERWMESKPTFAAVDRAIGSEGWKIVLMTRCSPLFPYVFQNYAYGLTRVSFAQYALGSFFGLVPGTLIFAYVGSLGASGVSAAQGATSGVELALRALGLVATILVSITIARASERALEKAGV